MKEVGKPQAHVVADSIPWSGSYRVRLTTMVVRVAKLFDAQCQKHGRMGWNAESSRAKSVKRILGEFERGDMFVPNAWQLEQRGMSGEPAGEEVAEAARAVWLSAKDAMVDHATRLRDLGIHKQQATRLLVPWQYQSQIVTADQWGWAAFLKLRLDEAAQPHMQQLAKEIRDAYNRSKPVVRDFHNPFGDGESLDQMQISAARCARVSYGEDRMYVERSDEENLQLAADLIANGHWSAFEHTCRWSGSGAQKAGGRYYGWRPMRADYDNSL